MSEDTTRKEKVSMCYIAGRVMAMNFNLLLSVPVGILALSDPDIDVSAGVKKGCDFFDENMKKSNVSDDLKAFSAIGYGAATSLARPFTVGAYFIAKLGAVTIDGLGYAGRKITRQKSNGRSFQMVNYINYEFGKGNKNGQMSLVSLNKEALERAKVNRFGAPNQKAKMI